MFTRIKHSILSLSDTTRRRLMTAARVTVLLALLFNVALNAAPFGLFAGDQVLAQEDTTETVVVSSITGETQQGAEDDADQESRSEESQSEWEGDESFEQVEDTLDESDDLVGDDAIEENDSDESLQEQLDDQPEEQIEDQPQELVDELEDNAELLENVSVEDVSQDSELTGPLFVSNASQLAAHALEWKIEVELDENYQATRAEFKETFIFQDWNWVEAVLAKDNAVQTADGSPFDATALWLWPVVLDELAGLDDVDVEELKGSTTFGIPGQHLIFDAPVRLEVAVDWVEDWTVLPIRVKHEWSEEFTTEWLTLNEYATCTNWISSDESNLVTITDGKAIFYTCGASIFIIDPVWGEGSASNPFRSMDRANQVPSSGIYHFDIWGQTFSTYVDMSNGWGWMLIASGQWSTSEFWVWNAQTSTLTLQSDEILTSAIVWVLGDRTELRINATSWASLPFDVTTTNANVLNRFDAYTTLEHRPDTDWAFSWRWSWQVTNNTLNASNACNWTSQALNLKIIHNCGNGNWIHWIPDNNNEYLSWWTNDFNLRARAGTVVEDPIELWFKADDTWVSTDWATITSLTNHGWVAAPTTVGTPSYESDTASLINFKYISNISIIF